MTPETPALPDLTSIIASHRLAREAALDSTTPAGLVDLLVSGREAAIADLGDRLLDGVRVWLVSAGVSDPIAQDDFLDALSDALAMRDQVSPDLPLDDLEVDGEDALDDLTFEMPGSFVVAAAAPDSEVEAWFIPLHEPADVLH